ncbi:hypothetical protein HMPREF9073_00173, partial [Capnocytophaga sp. oral taxon 326 str. F0382]
SVQNNIVSAENNAFLIIIKLYFIYLLLIFILIVLWVSTYNSAKVHLFVQKDTLLYNFFLYS